MVLSVHIGDVSDEIFKSDLVLSKFDDLGGFHKRTIMLADMCELAGRAGGRGHLLSHSNKTKAPLRYISVRSFEISGCRAVVPCGGIRYTGHYMLTTAPF